MSMPSLPDWLPWWVPILVLVPALLYALALLFMPFAVFGVKGRLEAIEARLDEIQGEIRSLALRMPEPAHHAQYDEAIYAPPSPNAPARHRPETVITRPPIPPAPFQFNYDPADDLRAPRRPDLSRTPRTGRGDSGRGDPGRNEPRNEPRLDWPR